MIDPRFLTKQGEQLKEERLCRRCGYQLRGLRLGDPCPECGTAISGSGSLGGDGAIIDAPLDFLKRLAFASWLHAIGAAGMVATALVLILMVQTAKFGLAVMVVGLLFTLPWIAGVWLVTTPRQLGSGNTRRVSPEQEWWRLRLASRLGQAGWPLGVGILCVVMSNAITQTTAAAAAGGTVAGVSPVVAPNGSTTYVVTGTTPATLAVGPAVQILGGIGILVLIAALATLPAHCVYVANLAEWGGDTTLAARLRMLPYTVLGAAVLSMILKLTGPLWHSAFLTFVLIPVVVILIGVIGVAIWQITLSVWGFAMLLSWSVSNSISGMERDQRVAKKIVQRIEDGKRTMPSSRIGNR